MEDPLIKALGQIKARSLEDHRQSVRLRKGIVHAINPTDPSRVTINVGTNWYTEGDLYGGTAQYPDMPTVGPVSTGDVVFWLQTNSGGGVVLGRVSEASGGGGSSPSDDFVVYPSGDTSGAVDTAAINTALTDAYTAGGGTVTLGHGGPWYINDFVVVPTGVNLWGQGMGELHAATRFVCTTAQAGIGFGNRDLTPNGRAGVSGNFCVDGNNTAINPLYVGFTVQRTFIAMEAYQSAAVGLRIEAAQNCNFYGCAVSWSAGSNMVFDRSAQGNRFYGFENDNAGTWHVEFLDTGPPEEELAGFPFDNHFFGGIFERGVSEGCINNTAGQLIGFHDLQIINNEPGITSFVFVDCGEWTTTTVEGGYITSNAGPEGLAFRVRAGATLTINGTPTINAVDTVFNNSGTVYLNAPLRILNHNTYVVGTPPVEPGSVVGTIPVVAAGVSGLTTDLTAVPGSWWRMDRDSWPAPPTGKALEYQLHVMVYALDEDDEVDAMLVDHNGIGMVLTPSGIADADGAVEVVSAWTEVPTPATHGYIMVRNYTAGRGVVGSAFLVLRIT